MDLPGVTVTDVDFQPSIVVVTVKLCSRPLCCPECGFSTKARYDLRKVAFAWRHLDLEHWPGELRRLTCATHGVRTEGVLFARSGSRHNRDFEDLVGWLATTMDKTALRRLVRVDWNTVGCIIERVMATGLDPGCLDKLFSIGVDELSVQRPFLHHPRLESHDRQVRLGKRRKAHRHARHFLRRARSEALRGDRGDLNGHGPRVREVSEEGPRNRRGAE